MSPGLLVSMPGYSVSSGMTSARCEDDQFQGSDEAVFELDVFWFYRT